MWNTDWIRRLPWSLVASTLALLALGLTGIARGDELAHAGEFFSKQVVWIALALPAMFLATWLPYRVFRHQSYLWLGLSVALLAIVYVFPAKWGSRRWIPLGFMNFQPSELAKLAFILAVSRYLMYRENYRRLSGLAIPFALTSCTSASVGPSVACSRKRTTSASRSSSVTGAHITMPSSTPEGNRDGWFLDR
jgi:cell division protein FtsW (lipid II flippase)